METLLLAIIGHLVGDYLLQNDWMAHGKKLRAWPCVAHCTLWTYAVLCMAGPEWWTWPVVIWLFSTHYAIDRSQFVVWSMKAKGQSAFVAPPCGPWSVIVVDNVWHIVTLVIAAIYLG